MKEAYEKQYQQTLHDVQEKQKEPKLIVRPPNAPKSGPTDAGKAFLAAKEQREREEREKAQGKDTDKDKEKEKEDENKDVMDVDDPADGKGKSRK